MTHGWRIATVLLALGLASCWSGARMESLHVRDFGAAADGTTDDGPAIQRAVDAAVRLGKPVTVHFEPKVYRIGPRDDRWCSIAIEGARDVALDGHGATLLFHPDNRAFLILASEGIALRNFTVDFDPLPFTQGDVVRVDRERKEIVVRIHHGFPLPDAAPGRHGAFIERGHHRYTHKWSYIGAVRPVAPEERLYAISGNAKRGHQDAILQTRVGERFVFPLVYRPSKGFSDSRFVIGTQPRNKGVFFTNPAGTFQVRLSRCCTLENIALYASPAMCFRLTGTQDVVLRNIGIAYKPGSGRLMVSASDGMHCKNNKAGPVIEDCQFEGLLDDSINLSTMSEDVMETLSDTEFRTRYSDIAYYDSSVAAGDTLLVYDPVRSAVVDEVAVASVQFIRSHQRRITVARPLSGIVDAKAAGRERATRFYIKKTSPAVVRNCQFRSQMKTAILVRTPVVCEGNAVEDTAYGVHASNSFRFGEGPVPSGQVFRNNFFRDCWIAAIQLYRMGFARPLAPGGGPILVEDNTIRQGDGVGIGVHNFRDVTVRNNAITMRPDVDPRHRAIVLHGCSDVVVSGCTITDPRDGIEGAIAIRGMPRSAVAFAENRFRLAEGVEPLGGGR